MRFSRECSLITLLHVANVLTVYSFMMPHWSLANQESIGLRVRLTEDASNLDFDFSSPWAWEQYYSKSSNESDVLEWHQCISLSEIAGLVKQQLAFQARQTDRHMIQKPPTCLVVGCGNSKLPTILRRMIPEMKIVLLDSSPTLMARLARRYATESDYIECICDDATMLQSLENESIDIILDKGFLDALFCNEGWNGIVHRALTASRRVLKGGFGTYLWIGYKLPASSLDFVSEAAPELKWDYGFKRSGEQVCIRLAVKDG